MLLLNGYGSAISREQKELTNFWFLTLSKFVEPDFKFLQLQALNSWTHFSNCGVLNSLDFSTPRASNFEFLQQLSVSNSEFLDASSCELSICRTWRASNFELQKFSSQPAVLNFKISVDAFESLQAVNSKFVQLRELWTLNFVNLDFPGHLTLEDSTLYST